jgi:hypothetical protein
VRLIKQGLLVLIAFPLLFMAVLLANTAPAAAANPLLCFDGTTDTANGDTGGAVYGGVCTILPGGTSASLNNTVTGPNGQYSGVYYATSNLSGDLLTSITQLSFDFTGAATAGSPRISLPIDTNNNGTTDFFAFISGFHCNNGAGHVDPIHNASCLIFYTGGPVSGQTWAQFTANGGGTWRVATDTVPFVIADDVGFWTVSNVQLGQGENANVATAKDECKKGGWSNLTRADGSQFKNQGDCIQYVNTGK